DRHTAIWENGAYAKHNSHRMAFYIQMILQADKMVLFDGTRLERGYDIFTTLYLYSRSFGKYSKNKESWDLNKTKLGFEMFSYNNEHGPIASITGNDFMLVTLSYITQKDWTAFFDMFGLRNSDTAIAQAKSHGVNGSIPVGLYVLDTDLPPLNISEGLDFLPLGLDKPDTLWPRDMSSPVQCNQ
ncbi:hypothetical protein REH76_15965, partial [Photobacterium damselae]